MIECYMKGSYMIESYMIESYMIESYIKESYIMFILYKIQVELVYSERSKINRNTES